MEPLRSGLGQATYTCVPMSPSSITWYRSKGGYALRLASDLRTYGHLSTYGHLHSLATSLSFDRYQVILLGDRGTQILVACLRPLHNGAEAGLESATYKWPSPMPYQ